MFGIPSSGVQSKGVIVKVPLKVAGIGDCRLSHSQVISRFGQASFGSRTYVAETSEENSRNKYLLERTPAAISEHKFRDQDILFRMLNDKIRFVSNPDTYNYFVSDLGDVVLNPAYEINAEDDLKIVREVEDAHSGTDIFKKVKAHKFFGMEQLLPRSADAWALDSQS